MGRPTIGKPLKVPTSRAATVDNDSRLLRLSVVVTAIAAAVLGLGQPAIADPPSPTAMTTQRP
jgi:hypothetical protein